MKQVITSEDDEANHFAMCLLMPEEWLLNDLKDKKVFDLESDAAIPALAERYDVSVQLMTVRLCQLKLIKV